MRNQIVRPIAILNNATETEEQNAGNLIDQAEFLGEKSCRIPQETNPNARLGRSQTK